MWEEITYLFPIINSWFHPTLNRAYDYLSLQGLMSIHVSKRAPGDAGMCRWSWSILIEVMASSLMTQSHFQKHLQILIMKYIKSPLSPRSGVTLCFHFISPPPLPQRLLPLMSKPVELNLRYLGQTIYIYVWGNILDDLDSWSWLWHLLEKNCLSVE